MKNLFYVYVHRRATTGEPFYYGKGKDRRAWVNYRNKWHSNVVKKHGKVVEILYINLTDEEARQKEKYEISQARLRKENIVNMNDGGEGGEHKSTRKTIENQRKSKTGLFSQTKEQLSKNGKKGGYITGALCKEKGIGVCGICKEKQIEQGRKNGLEAKNKRVGIFAPGASEKGGRIMGEKSFLEKTGVHARSKEQMRIDGLKAMEIQRKNKTGFFSPDLFEAKSRGGKKPWWNNPVTKETKRDYVCPGEGFIKGRGKFK